MMFAFYGVTKSEEELATRLRTNEDVGTLHRDMIRVAREEGFYVFENEESSIFEIGALIKMRIPVIVHFVEPSEDDNHYAVVVKVNDSHLILNDPWNGERVTMEINDFIERWSSERASHEKWVMAISHDQFSLGRQYAPKRQKIVDIV
jgi:ABC-type bacteriocin/lantibiotic exporter with double-glycine peptidase domain